jgi:hypothetical protein
MMRVKLRSCGLWGAVSWKLIVAGVDPSRLATNRQYFGNVAVTSSDSSILNQQNIRVGLRIGNTARLTSPFRGPSPTSSQILWNPIST